MTRKFPKITVWRAIFAAILLSGGNNSTISAGPTAGLGAEGDCPPHHRGTVPF